MTDDAPKGGITFTPEEELSAYRSMLLIRRFEEKAGQLFALGAIRGTCQLSIGQEGAIVGMEMAAEKSDPVLSGRRCHGHMLARGLPPDRLMAELLGRQSGLQGGAGGSTEIVSEAHAYYGGHPTRGAQVPIGAGLAFASRYQGTGAVCLCSMGDGAAGKGIVHETLRLAALWKLPVVFLIDNNSTASSEMLGSGQGPLALAERGAAFGIAVETVEAIDVRKVREAGRRAIARARSGEGPTVLELLTYAYRGHAAPSGSRSAQPERRREETDPLAKSRARILEDGVATDAELKKLEKSIKEKVTAAASFARAAALPDAAAYFGPRLAGAL